MAEYTETVRFGNNPPVPMGAAGGIKPRKRQRLSGMSWIFVGLIVFFVAAAAFTAIVTPLRHVSRVEFKQPVSKSFVGVQGFDSADGGVTFSHISVPGGPLDNAGLVGGDIITNFDGQPVKDEDDITTLLERTPIGKTVDVTFIRDGATKTTKLTTISNDEFNRLRRAFEKRPEGQAQFGYEDDEAERVAIPNTKIFGVKLNKILPSRPADLAGVKDGDVVTEFDGVPIRTTDEFLMRVKRALPYSTVKLVVMRGDEKIEIPVKMGRQ